MASARKTFNPKKSGDTDRVVYKSFIDDLLSGTVKAEKLVETKNGQGKLTKLEYDDPNG